MLGLSTLYISIFIIRAGNAAAKTAPEPVNGRSPFFVLSNNANGACVLDGVGSSIVVNKRASLDTHDSECVFVATRDLYIRTTSTSENTATADLENWTNSMTVTVKNSNAVSSSQATGLATLVLENDVITISFDFFLLGGMSDEDNTSSVNSSCVIHARNVLNSTYWSITESNNGSCYLSSDGMCVSDGHYGSNESCAAKALCEFAVSSSYFVVKGPDDVVAIGGISYSGSNTLSQPMVDSARVNFGAALTFRSGTTSGGGWSICVADSPTVVSTSMTTITTFISKPPEESRKRVAFLYECAVHFRCVHCHGYDRVVSIM